MLSLRPRLRGVGASARPAAGAARVRAAYQAHETVVVRLSGLIFLGFAAAALHAAAPNLIRLLAG